MYDSCIERRLKSWWSQNSFFLNDSVRDKRNNKHLTTVVFQSFDEYTCTICTIIFSVNIIQHLKKQIKILPDYNLPFFQQWWASILLPRVADYYCLATDKASAAEHCCLWRWGSCWPSPGIRPRCTTRPHWPVGGPYSSGGRRSTVLRDKNLR